MSSTKTALILGLLLLSNAGKAQTCANETQASQPVITDLYDKETIKQALLIVLQSQAVVYDNQRRAKLNKSLIEEMRRDGTIIESGHTMSSVCIDPSSKPVTK